MPTYHFIPSVLKGYHELVAARKACRECAGLRNPADVAGGALYSKELGPWTLWQGEPDARVLVVGQDWGDVAYFERSEGFDDPSNPTNRRLVDLLALASTAAASRARGLRVFTNAILCLKDAGMRRSVDDEWF